MTEDEAGEGWVGLREAIDSLRADLAAAWLDGGPRRVRFRVEPVELTVQVGVTRTGKGSAGVKWHVLTLGGERSREVAATQSLKLRLAPVFFGNDGKALPDGEQLIADHEEDPGADDAPRYPSDEPE